MKLTTIATCAILSYLAINASADQSTNADSAVGPFGLFLGYKSIPVKQSFTHNTNPDDGFLPNANVPGSAGTTSLNNAHYMEIGFRFDIPVPDSKWSFNINASGLFAFTRGNGLDATGMNLDDTQNANDNRQPGNASFVYTDSNWGFDGSLGVDYKINKHVYVGAVADLAGVFVNSGWDRNMEYTSQSSKLAWVPSGGPKLGVLATDNIGVEGTALFGKNGFGYQAGIVVHF